MSNSPFAKPAPPGEGIQYGELHGSLLLIEVHNIEDHIPTVHTKPGEKSPAVRATVNVLDGPKAGETFADTLIFPKLLQGQLKANVGGKVIGRLGQGNAKPGQSPPWLLSEATPQDEQLGVQWLNQQAGQQMAQPAPAQQQQAPAGQAWQPPAQQQQPAAQQGGQVPF